MNRYVRTNLRNMGLSLVSLILIWILLSGEGTGKKWIIFRTFICYKYRQTVVWLS